MLVSSRADGYINATQLCKAGGKQFNHWYSLDGTGELIRTLEEEILNPDISGIKIVETKSGRYGGSWIHPDLAIQLAQWISPKFAVRVSRCLYRSVIILELKVRKSI